MASPTLIIFRHGSYSFFAANMAAMPEGEPYEAGLVDAQGNAIEILYIGGHDGQNKIIGGGFQLYAGNLADITAPQGTAVIDSDSNLWISNGSSWKQQSGTSSVTSLDFGSLW